MDNCKNTAQYYKEVLYFGFTSCPWQEVAMQCKPECPVREKVSQDALCGRRTVSKVWEQSDDGVWRPVFASISGLGLQVYAGV